MKKFCLDLLVRSVEHLSQKHVLLRLASDDALPTMKPGQFVQIRVDHSPETFLRRPISINFVDEETQEIGLLIAVAGHGTDQLSRLQPGERLNCIFPLGNSFSFPQSLDERFLLVGGGVGVAPLLFFGKQLHDLGCEPTFLLGARSEKDLLELNDFRQYGRVFVTTEDGSAGEKGFVTNHSILSQEHFDRIASCGPMPMMKAVARYATKASIECEVSLENLMACGVGACLCCVEKTTEGNQCMCTEGPVLNIKKLLWQS